MIRGALAAILMTSAAAAGAADGPQDAADMRCVIVAAEMADSKEAEQQNAGSIMLFYYLGRLDGRTPAADLPTLLAREAVKLSPEDKARLLTSCSELVGRRGEELGKMGGK